MAVQGEGQVGNTFWRYTYDDLGQVTGGNRCWADGTPVAGQQFEYTFDDIGNRKTARVGGDAAGGNLRPSEYTPNLRNQYTQRTVPGFEQVLGEAEPGAFVTVGDSQHTNRFIETERRGRYYRGEVTLSNEVAPAAGILTVVGVVPETNGLDAVSEMSRPFYLPATPEVFVHDADGNLTNDGRWIYSWDDENRLIQMQSKTNEPVETRRKLEYDYDYQSRRVARRVHAWNLSTLNFQLSTETKFLYDGWNLVAEYAISNQQSTIIRSYTWGLDLSGSMQGAGGVGGLLSMTVHQGTNAGTYLYYYDGNGNVLGLVNATNGTVAAQYEYGPFGETLRATGPLAHENPFRWSTKYTDDETGLVYYGYRYYNPTTGRWLSRDPIGEEGALNIYQAFYNNPLSYVDRNGLDNWSNPGAGQNAPPVFIYPPPTSPRDPVNTESKKVLQCFITGQSESFVYGPNDPWTKRMQQHPHMDNVRLRIKYELSKHCAGKGGALSGIDNFNQQQLPAWDKGVWLANDLISWATDGSFGTDPGFRFGSFGLSWRARIPHCCCKTAVVLFLASDVVRLQSGSRHPITGNPIIPVDEPLGPGLPLQNVPINWTWTEIIGF